MGALALALSLSLALPVGLGGPEGPRRTADPRREASLLAEIGERTYRLGLARGSRGDLLEAAKTLEEALGLDEACLRALGFLGLVRLSLARRAEGVFDGERSALAREALEGLFRLSEGWTAPPTRALLAEVAGTLDKVLPNGTDPPELLLWWSAWRERVTGTPAGRVPSEVESLAGGLRTAKEAWVRAGAARELGRARDSGPAAEALVHSLRQDPSPAVRIAAAEALARTECAAFIIEAFRNDPDPWVRRSCASSLDGEEAAGALIAALRGDVPIVAAAAARRLGELGSASTREARPPGRASDVEEALLEAVRGAASLVRREAARALARRAGLSRPTVEGLLALLSSPAAEVRAAAAGALTGVGFDKALLQEGELLGRLAAKLVELAGKDPDGGVRASSLRAAARLLPGHRRGADSLLRKALLDPDPRVRLESARALLRLGPDIEARKAEKTLEELSGSDAPCEPLLFQFNEARLSADQPGSSPGLVTVGELAREELRGRGGGERR